MSPELAAEHLEDLLADPAALGERGEGEVVGVHFAQTWKKIMSNCINCGQNSGKKTL